MYILDILTINHHIDCGVHIISYAIACLATVCSIIGSVVGKIKLFTSKQYIAISTISKHFRPRDVWRWFAIRSRGKIDCWATLQHNLARSSCYQCRWVYKRIVNEKENKKKTFEMSILHVKGAILGTAVRVIILCGQPLNNPCLYICI